jgi:adenylate cyclase
VAVPMPFDRVQCEDLSGWTGDLDAAGWRKVAASVGDLVGEPKASPAGLPEAHLPLPSKPSVAVMPFANLSGDAEEDYFADGMVDEIVTVLTRFKSIFVIGSGSTLSFKGKAVSPQEIGRRLGVRYALEGSVRKAGGRVRISVKLADATDGAQVWSERFEDTLQYVFALQDRVALSVAGQIEPTVQVAEIRRASARPTESLGSYQLYLRAWALERTFVKANVLEALDLLNRAIALDPDFAPALALAAICHRVIFNFHWSDDRENDRRQGVQLAHRALRNSGDDATVLANVASVLGFLERDQDATLALHERALALNPGSSFVWFYSDVARLQAGQSELGTAQLARTLRLEPIGVSRPMLRW